MIFAVLLNFQFYRSVRNFSAKMWFLDFQDWQNCFYQLWVLTPYCPYCNVEWGDWQGRWNYNKKYIFEPTWTMWPPPSPPPHISLVALGLTRCCKMLSLYCCWYFLGPYFWHARKWIIEGNIIPCISMRNNKRHRRHMVVKFPASFLHLI